MGHAGLSVEESLVLLLVDLTVAILVAHSEHGVELVPFGSRNGVTRFFLHLEDELLNFSPREGVGTIGVKVHEHILPAWEIDFIVLAVVFGGAGGVSSSLIVVTTGVVVAAIGITSIIDVHIRSCTGVAVGDITVITILIVVGHGVVAISIWSAVWVLVGAGRGGVVPAGPLIAMVVVNPVGKTVAMASVVVAPVSNIIGVTKVAGGRVVGTIGAVRAVITGIRLGVVPAGPFVAVIVVDPVASLMAAVASTMVAPVSNIIVVSEVGVAGDSVVPA